MSLKSFQDRITKAVHGAVAGDGCCLNCTKPPVWGENVYSEAGIREFRISGYCETCFDDITREPEEDEDAERDETAF